ncbi:hypothetical protein T11_6146 [Trichinella zimbabwensis]|uniref:Uncharacterized protein n=1 Tax=Trichinella zimbabwensis TaxID=268475 RepID=A0A0V1H508_9BILA|nr:hypothetical protein T11_6146 [Trichinella zimbabwensis]
MYEFIWHSYSVRFLKFNPSDEVAEWLRRWTANPLGFPRVGSNPILVGFRNIIQNTSSTFDILKFYYLNYLTNLNHFVFKPVFSIVNIVFALLYFVAHEIVKYDS